MSKSDILANDDIIKEKVETPKAWGTDYSVRALTGQERLALAEATKKVEAAKGDPTALIVCACLCHPDGSLVFGLDDAEALAGKPAVILDRIARTALAVNGLDEKTLDAAKKNSKKIPG